VSSRRLLQSSWPFIEIRWALVDVVVFHRVRPIDTRSGRHIPTCSWSAWRLAALLSSAWHCGKYTSGSRRDFRITGTATTRGGRFVRSLKFVCHDDGLKTSLNLMSCRNRFLTAETKPCLKNKGHHTCGDFFSGFFDHALSYRHA